MKQLLLTFFAVVLCYSLFFDNKTEKPIVDEINYIQEDFQISGFQHIAPDTMNFLTFYNSYIARQTDIVHDPVTVFFDDLTPPSL